MKFTAERIEQERSRFDIGLVKRRDTSPSNFTTTVGRNGRVYHDRYLQMEFNGRLAALEAQEAPPAGGDVGSILAKRT